jgi:hypothetical protein
MITGNAERAILLRVFVSCSVCHSRYLEASAGETETPSPEPAVLRRR